MMQNRILKLVIFCIITAMFLVVAGTGLWNLHKSRTVQLFGNLVSWVETTQKVVALTFDDGPTPGFTDEIISILDEYNFVLHMVSGFSPFRTISNVPEDFILCGTWNRIHTVT